MGELPATLKGLEKAFNEGKVSHDEALGIQLKRFETLDLRYRCTVDRLPAQTFFGDGGMLRGVGLAHKDIFNTLNRRPGVGHDTGGEMPGLKPAAAIDRLQGQGAANFAALGMAEFACGATAENALLGTCVNPLDRRAAVGGSSSGSAVAVASQMVYGSLGTDTAGSVRIPAATCAVLGLKTTSGLIPLDGVYPLAPSLDSVGILARSAFDARKILDVVANPGLLRPALAGDWRIKAWLPSEGVHAEILAVIDGFVRECGASALISDWPAHKTLTHLCEVLLHAEAGATHRDALIDGTASAAVQAVALAGMVIPESWRVAALAGRATHAGDFVATQLRDHDLFILPALPIPVPDADAVTTTSSVFDVKQLLAMHRFMGFVNYLGCPSIVIPVAKDARGLPISVQVVARPFHELDLLAFAGEVEEKRFGQNGFTEYFSR